MASSENAGVFYPTQSALDNKDYAKYADSAQMPNLFNLKLSDGDNIVNNTSQLGLKFNDAVLEDYSHRIKYIDAAFMWMNIDAYDGHNAYNNFHSQNQHRKETVNTVINCLQ